MTELPTREPVFTREGQTVMFSFKIDEGNVIGPRPATGHDKFEHAAAYRAFSAHDTDDQAKFNGADPAKFDHDGDSKAGGAPKGGNRKKPAKKV